MEQITNEEKAVQFADLKHSKSSYAWNVAHESYLAALLEIPQLLNEHDVVRSFFVLTYSGQFMDANMLQKGLYATDVPRLYSSKTTIELMMQQGRTITDMAGNQFISEAYFQNLSKCKLTEVHLSVLE